MYRVDDSLNLIFQPDRHWRFHATGFVASDGYTCIHDWETLPQDQVEKRVGNVRGFVDVVQMSQEQSRFNSHAAYESYCVAKVQDSEASMMVRWVDFIRANEDAEQAEIHSLCFASKTDTMLQMLRDSNEVLENFDFEATLVFPDTWLSKYRRYLVGESEVVVYRIRPRQVLSRQELQSGDWCAASGLGRELDILRTTPRQIAGVETNEVSFRRKGLWGTRVYVPVDKQWFVFQLLSPEQDYGIERGRLEGVLNSARFTQHPNRVASTPKKTSESELSELRTPDEGAEDATGCAELKETDTVMLSPGAKRSMFSWAEHPRARVTLEMRLMLHALTHDARSFDMEETAWFMERSCRWVVDKLFGGEQLKVALSEQRDVFIRAFDEHLQDIDPEEARAYGSPRAALLRRLEKSTLLAKYRVERVLSRPGERMHIATLARLAVALKCPLFGFDPNSSDLERPEESDV